MKTLNNRLTVCSELNRQGYMSAKELRREQVYNRRYVPFAICVLYKATIWPIVLLMKLRIPGLAYVVNKIARKVWIDRALK